MLKCPFFSNEEGVVFSAKRIPLLAFRNANRGILFAEKNQFGHQPALNFRMASVNFGTTSKRSPTTP